jgi:hypothetical protein
MMECNLARYVFVNVHVSVGGSHLRWDILHGHGTSISHSTLELLAIEGRESSNVCNCDYGCNEENGGLHGVGVVLRT